MIETLEGSTLFAKQSGMHPAELRNMVTSPGGTSAAALHELESGRLRTVLGPNQDAGRELPSVVESERGEVLSNGSRFARRVADRVVMMDEGTLVEDAPPEQFFEAPAMERTKQFLSKIL